MSAEVIPFTRPAVARRVHLLPRRLLNDGWWLLEEVQLTSHSFYYNEPICPPSAFVDRPTQEDRLVGTSGIPPQPSVDLR